MKSLKELLTKIAAHSNNEWELIESGKEKNKRKREQMLKLMNYKETLGTVFFECGANFLDDNVLKGNKIKLDGKQRVFLPPMFDESDFLPLFSFDCTLKNDDIQSCFNLELVNVKNVNPETGSWRILSLRFENGCTVNGRGDHAYPHMQINNKLDNGIDYELEWVPDHHPHVLLGSVKSRNSPIIVLMYLLVSLYGLKGFTMNVLGGIKQNYKNEFLSLV